ncbi:hypothetical protein IGI04_030394 [Brassica rapa subsp. trilocularis]|uniref:Uncharacterized protein n=1 Tax=Brassica rapa subsp. trilocularis TaxID=1813537 RepID=A0ABQ7LQL4_BRACM|nr:hypothetical protein IGI04_030394 [Brassica rapa subsp. trilocularis]
MSANYLPYERLPTYPFEDQAERSSIERVEQEIELLGAESFKSEKNCPPASSTSTFLYTPLEAVCSFSFFLRSSLSVRGNIPFFFDPSAFWAFRAVFRLRHFYDFIKDRFRNDVDFEEHSNSSYSVGNLRCSANRCRFIQSISMLFERTIPTVTPIEMKQEQVRSNIDGGSYEDGTKAG